MLKKQEIPKTQGLTSKEAEKLLHENGENVFETQKKESMISKIFSSLSDTVTVVLFVAALVSFTVNKIHGSSVVESFIIIAIVIVNSVISVVQENRAEKAIEALKSLSSPTSKVIRDGKIISVDSKSLVVGDVVLLEKGDIVSADMEIFSAKALSTDESSLTGESVPVTKEENSSVFSGTFVSSGHGKGIVFATGKNTEMGKIAFLLGNNKKAKTPLQKRLSKTSENLGNAAIIICGVIFLISLLRHINPANAFLTSVSLAVAAIPEGLPTIVTVMLSIGVTGMAKKKAVVKKLPSVETLGCTTVICSDKTGTLTENKLKAVSSFTEPNESESFLKTLFCLCNRNSSPTEVSLFEYATNGNENINLCEKHPIIDEVPFDSEIKLMATLHKYEHGKYLSVIKGAPEYVEKYCVSGFDTEKISEMTSSGLRVMGAAYCFLRENPENLLKIKYKPCGTVGLSDTPKKNAKDAVLLCKKAGIKVKMITGDHKNTASDIAKQLCITGDAYSMDEILSLPEAEAEKAIIKGEVFARSTPEFKVKIIEVLKKSGEVVAMTGDGVNDAPALKNADIGIAMGKNGTDVAREACDMILTDDNFSTIVEAVKSGRGIYANIKRAVSFLISCNIGEILTVFISLLMSLPSPVNAIQLLWVNLVTDSLPAIALGLEKTSDDVMNKKPQKKEAGLFSVSEKILILSEGVSIGLLTVIAYLLGAKTSAEAGSTMAFGVLSFSELFHSFNKRDFVFKNINVFLILSFIISSATQVTVMVIPSVMKLFGTVYLEKGQYIAMLLLSVSVAVFGNIGKIISGYLKKIRNCGIIRKNKISETKI